MIKYALSCVCGQRFDAWFQNSDAFDDQAARGLVTCPHCGGASVKKALMAPSVATTKAKRAEEGATPDGDAPTPAGPSPIGAPPVPAPPAPSPSMAMMTPDARRRVLEERLRAFRAHVEATSDYVGGAFADEARRIHSGESEERAIHGETTPEEAEALADEGVPFSAIPWIDRRDD